MIKRYYKLRGSYKYLDKHKKIKETPLKITKAGKDFYFVKKYPKFYLYEYGYGNGSYKECFDEHDLLIIERYGTC